MDFRFYLIAVIFTALFAIEYVYIKIAHKYGIVDKPNERSSHAYHAARGGGIIFPVSILIWYFFSPDRSDYFIMGILLLSIVSYADDVRPVHFIIRAFIQCVSIVLLLLQITIAGWQNQYMVLLCFVLLYFINIYNFMDGINGITGLYSLVNLISLWYVNNKDPFLDDQIFLYLFVALFVFLLFNFRKEALCFAGDVGSTSIAYALAFIAGLLMLSTMQFQYLIFFAVYFIDSSFTIVQRLLDKENIFKAHRRHLYQLLSNERSVSHRKVSLMYMSTQALINILFLSFGSSGSLAILLSSILFILYLLIRLPLHKKINGYYIFR